MPAGVEIVKECDRDDGTVFRVYVNGRSGCGNVPFRDLWQLVKKKIPATRLKDLSLVAGRDKVYTCIHVQR